MIGRYKIYMVDDIPLLIDGTLRRIFVWETLDKINHLYHANLGDAGQLCLRIGGTKKQPGY